MPYAFVVDSDGRELCGEQKQSTLVRTQQEFRIPASTELARCWPMFVLGCNRGGTGAIMVRTTE